MTMKRVSAIAVFAVAFLSVRSAQAQLLIDFNSTTQDGPANNQPGYQPYDAGHEVAADFVPRAYDVVFPSGNATVTVTPTWPNTTANTVQQMIDRGPANDPNWLGDNLALLTDWIGTDSRTAQGGNGDWDRTDATTPTYMLLTLSGLPAGQYNWLSYHHDTEFMWSDFQMEISTDGGATFGAPIEGQITSSSPGGTPPAPAAFMGDVDGDPKNLPSTLRTGFNADGVNDVVLRFAPFLDVVDGTGVHKQFFAMNAFELTEAGGAAQAPALSTWGFVSLGLVTLFVGAVALGRRRVRGCYGH